MIDWNLTTEKFSYGIECLDNIYRPKVVCKCDICDKQRIVTIRVKSNVVGGNLEWRCPACVGKSLSQIISTRMADQWNQNEYRENQLKIRQDESYLTKASISAKERWDDPEYRNKFPDPKLKTERFVERASELYKNKFDYSMVDMADVTSWRNQITIRCCDCNTTFEMLPQKHLEYGSCPKCRIPKQQREITEFINSLGYEVDINNRSVIAPLEIDVYIPQLKLGIEHHGYYWHSFGYKESIEDKLRHQHKALEAKKIGVDLKQFFCFEWKNNKELLKSMIRHYSGMSNRIYARNCKIIELNAEIAQQFFNINHLQQFRPARYYLALEHNGIIISAISISKREDAFELIRMATLSNYCVVGGGAKLINNAMRLFNINKLYTFADLRYSTGNVYEKIGFQHLYITSPNYRYIKNKIILSRQQCQKHKLHKLLGESFDPNLTESENMFKAGYRRLWDAGNIKMVKHA